VAAPRRIRIGEDRDRVVLADVAVGRTEDRLTLQVVTAEHGAGGVGLDALQLPLKPPGHGRDGAWIETGSVSAESIIRVHRAALAGDPVRRLLAGEPDGEVRDLPHWIAEEVGAGIHVEALRV